MKILIADAFDAKLPERLAAFGQVSSDMATLNEAEVLLIRSKTTVNADLIAKAPKLKLVIRGGVGMDNVDKKLCAEKRIKALNTPKASSVAVAEMAMALMAAIPARLIEAHVSMTEGKFLKSELKRTELFKKTLGLIGAGAIATETAKRAAAFGMKVIAFDPYIKEHPVADMVPTMDALIAQADYISIHTPLTDETRGMINSALIAKMKDGVIIINTGRGKCVVENDLAEALKSGKVRAYGTDVWFSDPPPSDCPLLKAPNVFMAPHIGASTKENLGRIGDEVIAILTDFNK
ncbi:MAG: hydroxyacid dehydrogenase [Holophagales bacterium]|jgi:D-3-phosphoglycerate dehydrogenase|nr:hydroxyacid dehydrogenase [Holophagales bacterium]